MSGLTSQEQALTSRPYIGGQAVIEGVMMRAPRAVAVAVRLPDGSIAVDHYPYRSITDRLPWLKLPFLRGAVVLVESLYLGMKALSWSAEQAGLEDAREDTGSRKEKLAIAGTLVFSIALGLLFFVALPHLLTAWVGGLLGVPLDADQALFHLVDGLIKIVLFLGYLGAIGQMKDIRRVFQYHGAEHKSIYAWEAGQELTVENVAGWSRLHPRCGTSFLLFVVVASIAVFTPVFTLLPPLPIANPLLKNLAQVAIKLPLMLPVAGLAYETIRLSSRFYRYWFCRWAVAPGLWLQRLTTRPPDPDQLEVAIASLQAAWQAHAAQDSDDLGLEGEAFPTGQLSDVARARA